MCLPSRFFAVVALLLLLSGKASCLDLPAPGRVEEIAAMLPAHPGGVGSPITDRAAWEFAAGQPAFRETIRKAEHELGLPVPDPSDNLFLQFSQNGNRTNYQKPYSARLTRLMLFTVAECLENKGRFLPAVEKEIRAICAERTWVMSAHDDHLDNFYGRKIEVDLGAASRSWILATADWWLAERLDVGTRQTIHAEIKRRVLDPFAEHEKARDISGLMHWMQNENNWNAVCHAGVVGSALAIVDSPQERAFFIAAAEKNLERYFSGFPADGYCGEGMSYWNYGFGHFTALAEAVRAATAGKLQWLSGDKVRTVALYAQRLAIQPGIYPAFADCPLNTKPAPWLLDILDHRLNLGIASWAAPNITDDGGSLYLAGVVLGARRENPAASPPTESANQPVRDYFQEGGVLVVRPAVNRPGAIAAALKGGNNNESHNHNDIGSYVVALDGKELIVDPGPEVYTKRTFSSHRYDSNVINSFGHSVPVVAGKLQSPGAKARAEDIQTQFSEERDSYSMEMKSAYAVPELRSLVRRFDYSRSGDGSLTVTDTVHFDVPQTFGTALITFGQWTQPKPGTLLITEGGDSLQVELSSTAEVEIKAEEIEEDLPGKRKPTRIGINFKAPVDKGVIALTITPVAK